MAKRKRPQTLLEAWSRLEKGTLLLVGSVSNENALRNQIEMLGLASRVAFLSPPTNDRLPNLYHAADIVQLGRLSDLGALNLLEAQACGVAAIRVTNQTDAAVEGELLVPGHAEPLFDALRRLIEDETLRGASASRARPVRRDFTEQRMVEAVLDAYQEVLKQKSDV